MKTTISYFLILFFVTIALISCNKNKVTKISTPVGFFENDWNGAMMKASELDRSVFVQYYADWCGKCADFKKNTLNDAATEKFLMENFVVLIIDMESGVGKEKFDAQGFSGIPVLAVYDKQEQLKTSRNGELPPTEFVDWITPFK